MPDSVNPVDRVARALADTVGRSRPRVAADGTDPAIPVAATVVLVRDGVDGPEVLLIERPDRGSFAGAWVFPGGKLEPVDAGDGEEVDAARRAAVRETWEETGLVLDPDGLEVLSVWDPPPGIALRIRTWFFVGRAPAAELALSAHEAVDAEWVRPADLLARHARGGVTLYPPTWVTLHSLEADTTADALVDRVRLADVESFETVARPGPTLLWRGDAEYDDEADDASRRHRID
ncbi:MAG: NUDIX domain-containing protein, partial [Microbacterium sp.]